MPNSDATNQDLSGKDPLSPEVGRQLISVSRLRIVDAIGAPAAVVSVSDCDVLHMNVEAREFFGYRRRELPGLGLERICPQLTGSRWEHHIASAAEDGLYAVAATIVQKTGTVCPVTVRIGLIDASHALLTFHDESPSRSLAERVQSQITLSGAVASVSRFLMAADGKDMSFVVETMAGALSASRGQIYRWDDELHTTNDGQAEWTAAGRAPVTDEGGPDDVSRLAWWFEKLNKGQAFQIPDILKLPSEASYLQELYQKAGTKATIVAPVVNSASRLVGVFGLVDLDLPRSWSREEVEAMQTVGEMLGAFWERKDAEDLAARQFLLERCIARVTEMLAKPGTPELGQVLEAVGTCLEVDGVLLLLGDQSNRTGQRAEVWARELGADLRGLIRKLVENKSKWWEAQSGVGRVLTIGNVDWLPAEAARERDLLRAKRLRSLAVTWISGSPDSTSPDLLVMAGKSPKDWKPEQQAMLQVVGRIVSTQLQRRAAEERLESHHAQQRGLAEVGRLLLLPGQPDHQRMAEIVARSFRVQHVTIIPPMPVAAPLHDGWTYPVAKRDGSLLPRESEEWWQKLIASRRPVALEDLESAHTKHNELARHAKATGARTVMLVPLVGRAGERAGMIWLSDMRGTRRWEDHDLEALAMLGRMLATHWQESSARRIVHQQAAIISQIRDALFTVSPEGNVLSWNRGAENLFGYTPEQAVGKMLGELLQPVSGSRTVVDLLAAALTGAGRSEGEACVVDSVGHAVTAEFFINTVAGQSSQPGHLIVRATDLSESIELRRQLEQLRRQEALGTLAGLVAHDFNNILGPIVAYTQLVRSRIPSDSPDHAKLSRVLSAAARGTALARQIMSFAKGGAANARQVDPAVIVSEVLSLVESSLPEGVTLLCNCLPGQFNLRVDPDQLHQVLFNLTTNAWQALAARDDGVVGGTIRVSIDQRELKPETTMPSEDLKPGKYVVVSVADDGPGIPAEVLPHLFDPFYSTKPRGSGTGLGLAVVAWIVRSHHGAVVVDSSLAKGATFSVWLPLDPSDVPTTPSQPAIDVESLRAVPRDVLAE